MSKKTAGADRTSTDKQGRDKGDEQKSNAQESDMQTDNTLRGNAQGNDADINRIQGAYMEYQLLLQEIAQIQGQVAEIEQHYLDLVMLINSLTEIKTAEPDNEILVPLLGGVFAKASLKDKNNFFVNVGSKVVKEMPVHDVENIVLAQKRDIENAQKQLKNILAQKTEKINEIEQILVKYNSDKSKKDS